MTRVVLDPTGERTPVARELTARSSSSRKTVGLLDITKRVAMCSSPPRELLVATGSPRALLKPTFPSRRIDHVTEPECDW